MRKLELLSPAGDMDRLKMSVLYGADAVYLAGTTFVTSVEDTSVAKAEYVDGKIVITGGLNAGQTKASITNGSVTQEFVITVRPTTGNGWL